MAAVGGNFAEMEEALREVVGAEHVRAGADGDAVDGVVPNLMIEPGNTQEVSRVLAMADSRGWRVMAQGGGTKLDWGNIARPAQAAEVLLSTARLNRVVEHAAGDMTATVQAGCPVAEFAQSLAQRGQRLALDPLWPRRATIGGILATHDSGALRETFGSLRDHLIGVTVVLADGTVAKSGGKVVKNVAGYDLPKLMIGSMGTLAVITEATFRLYPLAHASRTICFGMTSDHELAALLQAMAECSAVATAVQFEVADAGMRRISVLAEGLPAAIEGKANRIIHTAEGCGAARTGETENAWNSRENLFEGKNICVCKVSLLPTDWAGFLKNTRDLAGRYQIAWKIVGQIFGIGILRLDARQAPQMLEIIAALRNALNECGGTLTVLRCPPAIKQELDVWPDAGDALTLMRSVRRQFDPKGTLSPGRFVGGI